MKNKSKKKKGSAGRPSDGIDRVNLNLLVHRVCADELKRRALAEDRSQSAVFNMTFRPVA